MKKIFVGAPGSETAQNGQEEVTFGKSGWILLWSLFGLLFPRVQLYRLMAPFGLGLAGAISGPGAALVSLMTGIGYLLLSDVGFPLRYVAAILLISGIRWVFSGFVKLTEHAWFAPVLVFVSTAGTGVLIGSLLQADLSSILLSVSEGIVSAAFCYIMKQVTVEAEETDAASYTAISRAGWILVSAITYMSLSSVVISGISPANIAAGIFVLLMADALRERGGAVMGIVMSIAIITVYPDRWQIAVGYAFGGLLAGIFARFGRFAIAGSFAAATTVISLNGGSNTTFLIGVYETLAATVLFLVIPSGIGRTCAAFLFGRESTAAADGFRRSVAMRLDLASRAMEEVSATVDIVSRQLCDIGAPDLGTVYRDAAEEVCRTCAGKMTCWKRYYADTMASLNDLSPILREKSVVTAGDIRGHLARSCPRIDEMAGQVSRRYTEYHARESGARRLREIQSVVRNQFAGMSGIFSDFACEFSGLKRVDGDMADRVFSLCERHGLPVLDVVCLCNENGRMTLELLLEESYLRPDSSAWLREIDALCGQSFAKPIVTPLTDTIRVTLHQEARYAASIGEAQLICPGETVCGDAYEYFCDEEGRLQVILSDGMGTGGAAAVDGAMAAGLTARMLRAGFSMDNIVKILGAALMVKSDNETSATLDVLTVDLFSGEVTMTKAGACTTMLISRGRVSRIGASSLPIGILQDTLYERIDERVADGDILLMMSDGVMPEGDEWLEEAIKAGEMPLDDMAVLADRIATAARKRQTGHADDITVMAIRIDKT